MEQSVEHSTTLNAQFPLESDPEFAHGQDIGAFLMSVERQAYVIAIASSRDRDTALDIVQDAMCSMLKHYQHKPARQWKPLFFKVLNNRITDHHRKRGFQRLVRWWGSNDQDDSACEAVDQLAAASVEPDQMADANSLGKEIEAALQQLSHRQRQVVLLRLWQGLSVKETARIMGVTEGSVKTHLSRAVGELQKVLKDYREPEGE